MNIAQIEENVQSLIKDYSEDTFIFNLLEVYGKPKSSIARLQNGNYNLLNKQDEILWKKVVYFTSTKSENLHSQIDEARKNKAIIGHQPRFLIVTDFKTLLAVDTKTDDTLDIAFSELGKNFDFFLPWAGMEKAQHKNENPADVKAAEKMAKLYDEILKDNPVKTTEELHQLNVFLSRLLFCFFAEDTEIFPKASFTHSISSHTQRDGSDLNTYLHKLFEVLNTLDRTKYPEFLKLFPYVNGGLFTDNIFVPKFSPRSRIMLIEAGELDWSDINPDIFGSMFQAVVHVDQRAEMGSHDKSSGGHVDITVILGSTSQSLSWIGEAKIYRAITDLEEGFLQLSTRYRPASGNFNHNQCGLLIYVFRPDTKTLIEEWREHLKNTFTNTSNDIDDFKSNPFAFFSDFKHDSGLVFKVRHMPLCLHCAPKDKSARSRKKPNSVN